ncbi:MAG TPA: hypothetical protein VJZ91_17780 [Blastocatellia bacterium]|nr:hypothetical protein [Blastocatellia bacterium]
MAFQVPADAQALLLKLVLGLLAFVWVLWSIRGAHPRAVGMTITFPALNGVVLLTVTDKVVNEMVVGIIPLMLFNGFLPALFMALRRKLGERQWVVIALCLVIWAALAWMLESQPLWPHQRKAAAIAAIVVLACAAWAFARLRASGLRAPSPASSVTLPRFLRDQAARIFWFMVSLAIVSWVAYTWPDAHSLVGRLSALPLVPLFVLHSAVSQRRADLSELRISSLIGPVAAGAFLFLFTLSLGLIRTDAGDLHPAYWPIGLAMLLIEWELTRRLILGLSALTYRA